MKLSYRNERNAKAISAFWGKPLDQKDWFEIKAQSDDETEILVYDVIGWPFIEAQDFIKALNQISTNKILLRINSPGGDVFDAMAIFNALKEHKAQIVSRIESLAASAASFVSLSGDEVQAYKNSMMMIHEPWVFTIGNQYDLLEDVDLLSKISANMIDIYVENSKYGKRDLKNKMKEARTGIWFTASEMEEKGFIDTILDGKGVKARFDLSIFDEVPAKVEQQNRENLTIRDAEKALCEASFPKNMAKAILARGWNESFGETSDEDDQREVEDLSELAEEINSITALINGE